VVRAGPDERHHELQRRFVVDAGRRSERHRLPGELVENPLPMVRHLASSVSHRRRCPAPGPLPGLYDLARPASILTRYFIDPRATAGGPRADRRGAAPLFSTPCLGQARRGTLDGSHSRRVGEGQMDPWLVETLLDVVAAILLGVAALWLLRGLFHAF